MIHPSELIVDLFAGGGGASEGIFMATGRHPDIAVNHDDIAIAVHTANHPETLHHCACVWHVEPRGGVGGRLCGLLWASPDCRHFSRAAGGRPKWKSVRSLPGVVLTWATRVRPRAIVVENVREMLGWGPLLADGTPCPDRIGRSFNQWVGRLRGLGYRVEWRELCAADFGAPTIRTRLVVVACRDGAAISWPHPTHSRRPSLFEKPWRAAAECIDWSIPCPSIFTRKKPLADATLNRVAEGIRRYVLGTGEPFITGCGGRAAQTGPRPLSAPFGTVTAKADQVLVAASLATMKGASLAADVHEPLRTVCAGAQHHAVVAAFMAQHNGGRVGHSARLPISTLTTQCTQQNLVAATLSADDRAGAERVAAFLMSYYGSGGQMQDLRTPLGAITTIDRFALVTVHGVNLPIVDIGMRMLSPAELARAQGFPAAYVLDRLPDGSPLSKKSQVRLIGNSVCPPLAAAVIRAILGIDAMRLAA
jgi:DNA (cytosine-5)-methyltransferase 1